MVQPKGISGTGFAVASAVTLLLGCNVRYDIGAADGAAASSSVPPPTSMDAGGLEAVGGSGAISSGAAPASEHLMNRTPGSLPALWPPSAMNAPAMVYDSGRHVSVLFPGSQPDLSAGIMTFTRFPVWEWDGMAAWTDRTSQTAAEWPPLLQGPGVAYDSTRSVTVLFGGINIASADTFSNDTWEWNGTVFSHPQPSLSPPRRNSSAMTYDPVRKVTVMFGGQRMNDLWEWDGTNWTNRTPLSLPANWPPARASSTLVWDNVDARAMLFGGEAWDGTALSDLWAWNGQNWIDLTPADSASTWPFKRKGHGAVFDSRRGVMQVFGGLVDDMASPDPYTYAHDLWQWDSRTRTFVDLAPTMPPSLPATVWPLGTYQAAVAFDASHGQLVIFGGEGLEVNQTRWMYTFGP
jgi:Galactose oxidase, central domain